MSAFFVFKTASMVYDNKKKITPIDNKKDYLDRQQKKIAPMDNLFLELLAGLEPATC